MEEIKYELDFVDSCETKRGPSIEKMGQVNDSHKKKGYRNPGKRISRKIYLSSGGVL